MDAPAPDAPPAAKRGRGRPKGSTDKAPRTPRATTSSAPRRTTTASLEKRLGGSITTIGIGVCMFSAPDGEVVVKGAPALAKSLANLADQNPAVKANLERALTAGAWSGVLAAAAPILIGIAANHGVIPANVAKMLDANSANEANEQDVALAA